MFNVLWFTIALLIAVLLLFLLVDWYLKRDGKTKPDKPVSKKETTKPTAAKEDNATTEPTSTSATTLPAMNIYNSNLADDLDAILKTEKSQPIRKERSDQSGSKSHIADYVANKHYHTFNFADADATVDADAPMTFTKEDYKKIVVLSNIDDKK